MGLATVFAALISAVGTLCGALGGIALTSGMESRRQQRLAEGAAASEKAAAHERACTDLLTAITQLRVDVELACARHWRDMNVRLTAIQEQAVATGVQAARVAMISPDPAEAEAALALGRCASRLSAWTAKSVLLGDFEGPNQQLLPGQIIERPNLAELDEILSAFLRLVSPGHVTATSQPVIAVLAARDGASASHLDELKRLPEFRLHGLVVGQSRYRTVERVHGLPVLSAVQQRPADRGEQVRHKRRVLQRLV
jgi:hypothetical protein